MKVCKPGDTKCKTIESFVSSCPSTRGLYQGYGGVYNQYSPYNDKPVGYTGDPDNPPAILAGNYSINAYPPPFKNVPQPETCDPGSCQSPPGGAKFWPAEPGATTSGSWATDEGVSGNAGDNNNDSGTCEDIIKNWNQTTGTGKPPTIADLENLGLNCSGCDKSVTPTTSPDNGPEPQCTCGPISQYKSPMAEIRMQERQFTNNPIAGVQQRCKWSYNAKKYEPYESPPGWVEDGKLGEGCSGHGDCVTTATSFGQCECDEGWSGKNCETKATSGNVASDRGAPPAWCGWMDPSLLPADGTDLHHYM